MNTLTSYEIAAISIKILVSDGLRRVKFSCSLGIISCVTSINVLKRLHIAISLTNLYKFLYRIDSAPIITPFSLSLTACAFNKVDKIAYVHLIYFYVCAMVLLLCWF